eukprot:XP_028336527.1 uncharacterized protein C22orf15 homolog [Physeter catodon]
MVRGQGGVLGEPLRAPRQRFQPFPASLSAPPTTIALLAEEGHLVNLAEGLEDGASPAPSMGSPLLQERGTYVLVQIISNLLPSAECEGGAPTCYESLLENLDERCPELAG